MYKAKSPILSLFSNECESHFEILSLENKLVLIIVSLRFYSIWIQLLLTLHLTRILLLLDLAADELVMFILY